ncbi:MAG: hypothetical protein QXY39_05675 [Thermofilaceae archaeon]
MNDLDQMLNNDGSNMIGFKLEGIINGDMMIDEGITVIIGDNNTWYKEIARLYGLCRGVETIKRSVKTVLDKNIILKPAMNHDSIICELDKIYINLENYKYLGTYKELDVDLLSYVLAELAEREIKINGIRPSLAYDSPYTTVALADERNKWFIGILNTLFRILMVSGDKLIVIEDVVDLFTDDEMEEFSKLLRLIMDAHRNMGFKFYMVIAGVHVEKLDYDILLRFKRNRDKIMIEKIFKS